jgi:hypothetical protein
MHNVVSTILMFFLCKPVLLRSIRKTRLTLDPQSLAKRKKIIRFVLSPLSLLKDFMP